MKVWKKIAVMVTTGAVLMTSGLSQMMLSAAADSTHELAVQSENIETVIDLWSDVIRESTDDDSVYIADAAAPYAEADTAAETMTVNCGYMYDMLATDAEREFYDNLLAGCQRVDSSSKSYTMTPYASYARIGSELGMEVAWIFYYDHPEFFWMNPEIHISSRGIAFSVISDFQSGTERASAKETIFDEVQQYIDGALQYAAPYDRAQYLYQTLRENVTYQAGDCDQTIASVFLEHQTVCAGYSKAYALLCNAVGVDAVSLNSCSHGWNVICLSGQWYIVDVTNGYWLLSAQEMYEADVATGVSYAVTYLDADGEEVSVTYYAHDIYLEQYPVYASQFPVCDASYNSTSSSAETLSGDVNLDGIVALSDVVLLQKYLLGIAVLTKEQAESADVLCDGVVNGMDLSVLRQMELSRG